MTDSIILYQLKAKSLLYLVFIAQFAIRELRIRGGVANSYKAFITYKMLFIF